jgi:hypothetical protein
MLDYRGQLLIVNRDLDSGSALLKPTHYRDLRTPEIQVCAKTLRSRNRKKRRRLKSLASINFFRAPAE